ncbi:hemerythrin domain-containing protein [Kitasatospora sp. DSM 101779]|uniref:hemerythrin domain-containing protein n=1 Tax=Kitasatospora sp. DSM 101779 TaxID=2853165 RepID=UPI0021D94A0C|nr:hemerythrin domain-containing protein [Kitasatospora sp. DSM 101779]MCU7826828.1 hemerythrin domain-containing protein [Kitasatospora sp. DSM 101779]
MTSGDLIDVLTTDHDRLRNLFGRMAGTPLKDPLRRELLDEAAALLERHMAVEAEYLYPLALRTLPDRRETVEQERAGLATMGALLDDLSHVGADAPLFDRKVALLVREVTGHASEEQALILRELGTAATVEELADTGTKARTEPLHKVRRSPADRPRDDLPPTGPRPKTHLRDFFRIEGT